MTAPVGRTSARVESVRAGTITLVLGIAFAASTMWIYVLSLSDLVDPPNWIRALGSVGLPLGLVGVPIAWSISREGAGRTRARVGLVVTVAGVVAFVLLVVVMG